MIKKIAFLSLLFVTSLPLFSQLYLGPSASSYGMYDYRTIGIGVSADWVLETAGFQKKSGKYAYGFDLNVYLPKRVDGSFTAESSNARVQPKSIEVKYYDKFTAFNTDLYLKRYIIGSHERLFGWHLRMGVGFGSAPINTVVQSYDRETYDDPEFEISSEKYRRADFMFSLGTGIDINLNVGKIFIEGLIYLPPNQTGAQTDNFGNTTGGQYYESSLDPSYALRLGFKFDLMPVE